MKFKIKKETTVINTNIEGKVLTTCTVYYIYRSLFGGIFKMYVRITPKWNNGLSNEYRVEYVPKICASHFYKAEAECVIQEMKNNPDRFVRYK